MSVRFYTSGLLSKYGFDDGDLLVDILCDHDFAGSRKRVLAETVIQHVIPVLDQKVELLRVTDWDWSGHNPIRVEKVNGIQVDDIGDEPNPKLTPEFVDVEEETILVIARRVGKLKD